MKSFQAVVLSAVACSSMALPAAATRSKGNDCHDVRASQVDARIDNLGESQRCGLGIRIFGLGGGIFGPSCPDKKATYPAHQVCRGEVNPGTRCVPEGRLPVVVEDCECSRATVLGTGLLLPSCNCHNVPDESHVEDARTEACPPILDPREP